MRGVRDVKRQVARLWRLCQVDGQIDATRLRIVCDRFAERRRPVSPAVVSSFRRLLRRESDRHIARVESAVPLDADACKGIDRVLAARYGRGITTTFAVNSALIGGVRITVGSDVYDDSVRARLAALDASFAAPKVRAGRGNP